MGIKAQDIGLVDNIFNCKNWNKSEPMFALAYNNTLEILAELNDDEKSLFIKLLSDFNRYGDSAYSGLLFDAVTKIPQKKFKGFKKILFVPIRSPKDKRKSKSSDMFPYIMRTAVTPYIESLKTFSTTPLSTPEELWNIDIDKNTLIIALDDFIGSGKTVRDFHVFIKGLLPLGDDQVIFLSLVCMEGAEHYLTNKGLNVYSAISEKRGISDNPSFHCKTSALETLRGISEKLNINISRYRGWYKSEALVNMMNTPNNTLPIFWSDKGKLGKPWPAPFKRIK